MTSTARSRQTAIRRRRRMPSFFAGNVLLGDNVEFEGGVGDWTVSANCTIASDATHALAGTNSLMLTPTGVGPLATILNTALVTPITPNATYRITAYGTAAGGLTRNFTIQRATFTSAPAFIGFSGGTVTTLNATAGTWVEGQLEFTAEATATRVQVTVGSGNMGAGGTEFLWVDSVSLKRIA